jgi:hypothetical protein
LDEPVSLAGEWQFQLDPSGRFNVATIRPDRTIRVPSSWQAAFPELRRYSGYAWYRRSFEVEGAIGGGDLRLRFGAVDYWCEVFLNGVRLGEHEGGYTPFEFGLRDAMRIGRNDIAVRVFDPVQSAVVTERWPDFDGALQAARHGPPFVAAHVPHGKQDWYINMGGIWQDVTLTPRRSGWIDRIHVTPEAGLASAHVELVLAGDVERLVRSNVLLAVRRSGETVAQAELTLRPNQRQYATTVTIPGAQPWTPDRPILYQLDATAAVDDGQTRCSARFGMRTFAAVDGGFVLNGERLYLRGVLDQDFYPETVAAAPSADYLRDQFVKVKELGFNCVRCHIKPPDPIYLDLADEIGLLVWEEMPSSRTYWQKGSLDPAQVRQPEEERARLEEILDAVIERDLNHPSVVIRTLINEDWGTALPFSKDDRGWLRDLYDRCKRLDPTRLVVDNSACSSPWGTNFHVKSDIDDFHTYATIPDQAATFLDTIADLALRPLWTYSAHGDSLRLGDEPLVLSEFGNWGLPTMAALTGGTDHAPAWFDLRAWAGGWEQEPTAPRGVLDRFGAFGLDAIWDGFDAFATATQTHQVAALRFQIEALRRTQSIAGYVVTELTDTYWESNGILDFERRPKAATDALAAFNGPDTLVATPDKGSYQSGTPAVLDVHANLFSSGIVAGSRIEARIDGRRVAETGVPAEHAVGEVMRSGPLRVPLPAVSTLTYVPISVVLLDPRGHRLATTVRTVAVVPNPEPPALPVALGVLGGASTRGVDKAIPLVDRLGTRGYPVAENALPEGGFVVSSVATLDLLDWVDSGGRLLFLAERHSPFFWVQDRGGSSPGWVTDFSWIRPSAHSRLGSAANPLGLEFAAVMPEATITGLPFEDARIHGDILAGAVAGWVHHPTAHTVRFRFGRGLVVMTTFRLASIVGLEPLGTAMFDDLMDHLASERCRPTLGVDDRRVTVMDR